MNQNYLHNVAVSITSLLVTCALVAGCAGQGASLFKAASFTKQGEQEGQGGAQATDAHPGLLDPSKAEFETPDEFKVKVETTKGDFVLQIKKAWAPNGAGQFYRLCKIGYFKDISIFRAIEGFMFQFGIHGDPAVAAVWSEMNIKDDPFVSNSNLPYTLSFAQTGSPNSRSVQMFINLGDNSGLDKTRPTPFVPFGQVIEGKDVIGKINTQYGENRGDVQGKLKSVGNSYIRDKYPAIDFITSATIIEENGQAVGEATTAGGAAGNDQTGRGR